MMLLSKEKPMRAKQVVSFTLICMVSCWMTSGKTQAPGQRAPVRLYNMAKQKLTEGKQIVGATVFSPDPNIYCAMANAGYDFLWIEMQHGIRLGGPQAWKDRPGFTFLQGPGETQLIQSGARVNLGLQGGAQTKVAPIEGAMPH
jgi:hypothetical protein